MGPILLSFLHARNGICKNLQPTSKHSRRLPEPTGCKLDLGSMTSLSSIIDFRDKKREASNGFFKVWKTHLGPKLHFSESATEPWDKTYFKRLKDDTSWHSQWTTLKTFWNPGHNEQCWWASLVRSGPKSQAANTKSSKQNQVQNLPGASFICFISWFLCYLAICHDIHMICMPAFHHFTTRTPMPPLRTWVLRVPVWRDEIGKHCSRFLPLILRVQRILHWCQFAKFE